MFSFLLRHKKIFGVTRIMRWLYGCDIPRMLSIGRNVTFNHRGLGVVIHPNAIIEDNVYIEHHVLLGQKGGSDLRAPIIKKDCVIGAYAIILGNVVVGEGSVVGAGAIITHDIPPHSIVYSKQELVLKENTKPRGTY